jgi:hypothetical protein
MAVSNDDLFAEGIRNEDGGSGDARLHLLHNR